MLEDFSVGLNHAEVGALIAKKWNFPEPLVESIQFHHEPLSCSDEYRDVVFSVYLANALCDIERGRVTYDQLEAGVLADFSITSEEQLMTVLSRLQQSFKTTLGAFAD
jgi:HD-like signal output (HDOD) protein